MTVKEKENLVRKRGKESKKSGKEKEMIKKMKGGKKKKKTYTGNLISRGLAYLFVQEDASYLAVFRILWGSIMAYEAYTFAKHDFQKMFVSFYHASLNFKYYGFEWCVLPEDPNHMKLLIIAQLILGVFITIGFFYRTSSLLFFFAFSYMYLIEQANYLNHFYLVCVLSLMMVILPCNCLFSVDAYLWPKQVYSPTCPKWCLLFVRAELGVVYTYAGIWKFNEDWLRGEPLRSWLASRGNTPLIGSFLNTEAAAYGMSYSGMVYDFIIAELLFFKATLPLGILLSLMFHLTNKLVFNIGIFPWMMIASTTFYFEPSWPRRFLCTIFKRKFVPIETKTFSETAPRTLTVKETLIVICLALFLTQQTVTPLRSYAYRGTTAWNEFGHLFSWRMKLRTKKCDAAVLAYHPDSSFATLIPLDKILNRRQIRKVSSRPQMLIQFAHYIEQKLTPRLNHHFNTTGKAEVYVESWCELNSRPYQQLTNSTYELGSAPMWEAEYPWVTEVKPLGPKEIQNYPWNFEWNYNWLNDFGVLPKRDHRAREARAKEMVGNARNKWDAWIRQRDPDVVFRTIEW